jgi:hypothetical protein
LVKKYFGPGFLFWQNVDLHPTFGLKKGENLGNHMCKTAKRDIFRVKNTGKNGRNT